MDNFRRHSRRLDSFRVLLKHLHHYPGDKLQGVVEITVNHPVKYSVLEGRLIGEETTRFGTSLGWRFDSETRRNVYYKQRVIIAGTPPSPEEKGNSEKNSSENWSDADRSTVETEEGTNVVTVGLMPGTYTFPFTVVLPDVLPPSYSDHRGTGYSRLVYSLKIKLYAGKRVLGKDRTFFTVRMLPVNPLQWIAVHRKINPRVRSSSTVLLDDAAEGTSPKEGRELSDNDEDRNNDGEDHHHEENQVSQGSKTVLIDHQFSLCDEDEMKYGATGNENSEGDDINDDAASQTSFPNRYGEDSNDGETKKGKKKGKGKDKVKDKEQKKEKEREKKEKKKEEKEKKKKEKMEKKKDKKKKGEAFEDATNVETENNDENNCNDAEGEDFEGKEDAHSNASERDATQMSNKNDSSDENTENTPPAKSLKIKKEKKLDQDDEHSQQEEQSPHGGYQKEEEDEDIDEDKFIPVDPAFSDGQMWEYKLDVPISSFFKRGTVSVCVSVHSIICCRGKPVTFRAVIDNSRGISSVTRVVFLLVNRVRMSSRAESYEFRTVLRDKVLRDHTCREHKFGIPESQVILPNNTPLTLLTEGYACRTFLEVKISCVYGLRTQTGTARTEIAVVDAFDIQGNSRRVKKWTNYFRGREMDKNSDPLPDVICPFVTSGEMLVVEDELERLSASIPPPTISSSSEIKASKEKIRRASKQGTNVDYERVIYRPRSEPGDGGGMANPFRRSSWDKRVDLDD